MRQQRARRIHSWRSCILVADIIRPTGIRADTGSLARNHDDLGSKVRERTRDKRTMCNEIELVSDGDGLVVLGASADIEWFFHSTGLNQIPSRELDLHRLRSFSGTAGAAVQVGANLAANSGRWVKLTEPLWVSWRRLALETRMGLCRKNDQWGSRRHVGIRRRSRPQRSGWCGRCAQSWGLSTGLFSASRCSSVAGSSRCGCESSRPTLTRVT
jgi:hypothetical protein